jgi:hypothetical protein
MARKSAAEAMRYDVHPGVAMMQKWVAELPAKTGRTLEQWAELVRKSGLAAPQERREYGHGTNTAWWIVEYADGSTLTWDADPEAYLQAAGGYVDGMFARGKEWQRPIFETVVAHARALGPDVKVCPCKTIVPLYRTRVFAELKPATKTRLELALALGDVPHEGRLQANPRAKGDDRLRHLVALTAAKDFDAEVKKWLKAAYKADTD